MKKNIEDTRESLTTEIEELKSSQADTEKCYNQDAILDGCHNNEDG